MKNAGEKYLFLIFMFITSLVYGQKPREIQVDNEPPLWQDPAVIITLIVIPLIMIIFGIVWYKRRQRKIQNIKDQLNE